MASSNSSRHRVRAPARMSPPHPEEAAIHYRIAPANPQAHYFEVRCTVARPAAEGQVFSLPAWVPGSYLIREFARHIVQIRAEANGRRVALDKLDKHTWRAAPCHDTLTVVYIVYAWDPSVRAAHLDETHGFFNGTSVFLRVAGAEDAAHIVDIAPPAGAAYRSWRVATALPELAARRHGFGTYRASNYDELIDHPVEMGTFVLERFDACGVPHEIAITGRTTHVDSVRLVADLKTICTAQIRFFHGRNARAVNLAAPFARYVFLATAQGVGHGGLEHRASSALLFTRESLPVSGQAAGRSAARLATESGGERAYRNFLGLVSHEYFHSWNVKRIKPQAFAPYDLARENYTSLLWIFEGFTSYYDDLFLVRTRLVTHRQYLASLARTITNVLSESGRRKQSVAESSFDAWIKYYRQDENAANAIVSYYKKGSLVALALDLHLRAKSKGARSLDDVMRLLWQRYGQDFYPEGTRGLAEDGFANLVHEASGIAVASELRQWVYGTADLPLARLLAPLGLRLREQPKHAHAALGARTVADGQDCKLAQVDEDSAAQRAGLSAGDVLVAIDGLRVVAGNLDALLMRYRPGEIVDLCAFRRDHLFRRKIVLDAAALEVTIESTPTAREVRAMKARHAWLGVPRTPSGQVSSRGASGAGSGTPPSIA